MERSIFLVLAVLSSVNCMIVPWNDECMQYPDRGRPMLHDQDATTTSDYYAKPSCNNGTLYWNYPRGNILVHFRSLAPHFTVCFLDGLGADYLGLIDETTSKYHTLKLFNRDDPDMKQCVDSVSGEVRLKMEAPEMQTYMAALDYYIQ